MKTKYPQGGERQLIYATTGRAINSAMLPADAGCVVDNVATMVSVYQAVVEGKPSMERVVTVSGDAVAEPGNFRVPFGMNQQELVEAAGGFKTEPEKLISGGPMMGFSMFSLDVPVTKTSSSILGFTKDEVKADLENGYLTISAEKGLDKDEQEKETGRYIRKERYAGACSRSFYVGKEVEKEDIKAEFKHGILTLFVPKKEAKPAVEQKKTIAIEG